MSRIKLATAAGLSVLLCAASLSVADEPTEEKTLTIGDAAPKLDVPHWIKGTEVEKFEEGKIYVVEFWATWCGPCLAGMPHISELQEKYKDYGVTILGISDEPVKTITDFLVRTDDDDVSWDDKTRYTLATDPERSAHKDYMTAAGQRGIPTAFLVGKSGKVEWIGHPMVMDDVLEAVVRDEWDRDTFKAEFIERQEQQRKAMRAQQAMQRAYEAEDWDTLLGLIDEMIETNPNGGYQVQRFYIMLVPMNKPDEAYAYGHTMLEHAWDDKYLLNHVAWLIATDEDVQVRDLDFAMKAAKRATEVAENADASILDTVARVYYEQGHLQEAIDWQKKAVEAADARMAATLTETLESYQEQAKE